MILNGCRLGFYEPLRTGVTTAIFKDPTVQSLGINIFSGAASGILGAAAGSPFFLVKTRLQSYSPFLPVGTQHKYKDAVDGMRQINHNEGIKGLYRGVGAAMVRTGFGSSVQLPTYFFAKRRLVRHLGMEEGPALHLASSTASGFVVCCVMHPPGKAYREYGCTKCGAKHESRQIPLCRGCTTRPVTCTRVSSIACIRRSRRRACSRYTKVISHIWQGYCHTQYEGIIGFETCVNLLTESARY